MVFRNEGEVLNLGHLYQCGKKRGAGHHLDRVCFFAQAQYFLINNEPGSCQMDSMVFIDCYYLY